MKNNPQEVLDKIREDIAKTFEQNYAVKEFNLQKHTNEFKQEVNNYLDELKKQGSLVEGNAKKAKLPRKLKKKYKKEKIICLEVWVNPPINYLECQIEIGEED